MRKSKFTEAQIVTVLRQAEAGAPVPELRRKLGVRKATFFRWKKTYGSLEVAELRELALAATCEPPVFANRSAKDV